LTELAEDIRPAIGRQPARKTNGMAGIEPAFLWEVDSIPRDSVMRGWFRLRKGRFEP